MRILIDLQSCQSESRFRGIGRYSMSLALAIARQAGHHDIWLLLNNRFPQSVPAIRQAFRGVIDSKKIIVFSTPVDIAERHPHRQPLTKASEKIREFLIATLKPDVVHISSLFEGWGDDVTTSIGALPNLSVPTSTTLYDLIPLVKPDIYLQDKRIKQHYCRKIESLKKSALLLAISENSRQEAIKQLNFDPQRVVNISGAAGKIFKPITITASARRVLFRRYGIQKPFLMYAPGGFDTRKNIQRLIQAYAKLDTKTRESHQLLVTGKLPPETKANILQWANNQNLENHELVLTDYVSDDDLVALYNLCQLFVFPSLHEGFGLPVLEAMSCGAASIGSNLSSIPEVINYPEALFDPYAVEDIHQAIARGLSDPSFRETLKQQAFAQVQQFSWDATAKRAISAFEELTIVKQYAIEQQSKSHHSKLQILGLNHSASSLTNALSHQQAYRELITGISKIPGIRAQSNTTIKDLSTHITAALTNRKSQLLIDISQLVIIDAKSGIQRVVRSILTALLNDPPSQYQIIPVYWDSQQYRQATKFVRKLFPHLFKSTTDTPTDPVVDVACNDIFLGLDLTAHLADNTKATLEGYRDLGVDIYFVVYDILTIRHPEWWPDEFCATFRHWVNVIAEISTGLICISKATAKDIQDWLLHTPPHKRSDYLKISYFHLGADIDKSLPSGGIPNDAAATLEKFSAAPTILMVATVEPRKGHTQALRAFTKLWNNGIRINLVIVGNQGWQVDELVQALENHPEQGQQLFWLKGISDEYLNRVYSHSTALLAASEGEGFGLPLIEAAQHNLPIIARGLPVFREVAGNHAFYFEGSEPTQLADAIKTWLTLNKKGNAPTSQNMPWLTWAESTQQLLKTMITRSNTATYSRHISPEQV